MHRCAYFVLAGGRGERLLPLTRTTPKPLVRFGSRGAILDYTLYNVLASGGGDVYVLTQHLSRQVRSYVLLHWSHAFARAGRALRVVDAPSVGAASFRGTADAVRRTLLSLDEPPDHAAVLASDHVYRMDYGAMWSAHRRAGRVATVGCVPCPPSESHRFGILCADAKGAVTSFLEKPAEPPAGGDPLHASMGIYLFRARALARYLEAAAAEWQDLDFGHHVLPLLVEDREARVFPFLDDHGRAAYWSDVGDLAAYVRTHSDVLARGNGLLRLPPQPGLHRYPFAGRDLERGKAIASASVTRSALAPDAIVEPGARVDASVLCSRARVEAGAAVRNCVILDSARVPRGRTVTGSVLLPGSSEPAPMPAPLPCPEESRAPAGRLAGARLERAV